MARMFDKSAKGSRSFGSVGPLGTAIVNIAMALFVACSLWACGRGISLDPSVSEPQLRSDGSHGLDAADGSSTEVERGDADASVITADRKDAPIETNEGASDAVDETGDALPDGTVEAGDGCATACGEPSADYYVDANASPGGDGSSLRPYRTITAAIDAYSGSQGEPKTVRVAPGTYDEALGEHFPLSLRGLSLEGAGADKTFIVGTGELDHSLAGGVFNATYQVTLLIGDRALHTRIAGLTVRPTSSFPALNYHGVLCDRGSASGEVMAPGGQTTLDNIVVGPGYNVAVVATTSTSPSTTGCNLQMTGSTLTGGWAGLFGVGCARGGGGSGEVVLDIGGADVASGNTISSMHMPDAGWGVLVEECASGRFRFNRFVDDGYGVSLDQSLATSPSSFSFAHNTFESLWYQGLGTLGLATIDDLTDNQFIDISASFWRVSQSAWATALATDAANLKRARNNKFIGNDIGVQLAVSDNSISPSDFGTPADPGNNVFRCNSSPPVGEGADVLVISNGSSILPFAGNAWDHNPPTVVTSDPYADGSDMVLNGSPSPQVDTSSASVATADCPINRVPGP